VEPAAKLGKLSNGGGGTSGTIVVIPSLKKDEPKLGRVCDIPPSALTAALKVEYDPTKGGWLVHGQPSYFVLQGLCFWPKTAPTEDGSGTRCSFALAITSVPEWIRKTEDALLEDAIAHKLDIEIRSLVSAQDSEKPYWLLNIWSRDVCVFLGSRRVVSFDEAITSGELKHRSPVRITLKVGNQAQLRDRAKSKYAEKNYVGISAFCSGMSMLAEEPADCAGIGKGVAIYPDPDEPFECGEHTIPAPPAGEM
jgi:hypothetical protein